MRTTSPTPPPVGPRTAGFPSVPTILSEALFASHLQSSEHPTPSDVRAAIDSSLRALGVGLCIARVAQEFGDHPEAATVRMRWATDAVAAAYRDTPANRALDLPREGAGAHRGFASNDAHTISYVF
jgi:hypothetical protein